jgi:hypothetical protein
MFTRAEIFLNAGLAANVVQTMCCDSLIYTPCSVVCYLYAFYPLNCNYRLFFSGYAAQCENA